MKNYVGPASLYTFLRYCNKSDLEKKVLDCGAGGSKPPLTLFHQYGYKTFGIDISDRQLEKSNVFCIENKLQLNIIKGSLLNIPFEDESFSFVYSYNSIFHLVKKEIEAGINEIKRVLKKDGLCYVNLLSIEDFCHGQGKELEKGEFYQNEGNHKTIHSYYEDTEGDKYFDDFNIIYKEKRIVERYFDGEKIKQVFLDYIAKKK